MLVPMACTKGDVIMKPAAASLKFKFNGTAQTASLVVATYYKSQGTVQIVGQVGNQTQGLNLMINNIKIGTFDVAGNDVIASYSTATDLDHTYTGATGNVVVTTFTSSTIAGTFTFTGTNGSNQTGTITEGTFSAKLTTI